MSKLKSMFKKKNKGLKAYEPGTESAEGDDLSSYQYINQGNLTFPVVKTNRMGVKQDRSIRVNFKEQALQNIDNRGKLKKQFPAECIIDVERDPNDSSKLAITFSDYGHDYDLEFKDPKDREKFYVLVHLLRNKEKYNGFEKMASGELTGFEEEETLERVSIFTGTFNMGEAAPPSDLSPWIPPNTYDIYAVGVQECHYDPREGYTSVDDDMANTLVNHVSQGESDYFLVKNLSLWDIRIFVIAKEDHRVKINGARTSKVPTGIADICGNKGGAAVGFFFNETPLCFVNCHLAARATKERNEERNRNVGDIVDGLSLGVGPVDICSTYHHIFWFGDMNYRVTDIERPDCMAMIERKQWRELQELEQLQQERAKDNLLTGFQEGLVTFIPTYRYERGSRMWSTEKLQNLPSWCDRVLWKSLPNLYCWQSDYNCTSQLLTSDHSPVYSTFFLDTYKPYLPLVLGTGQEAEKCTILITGLCLELDGDDTLHSPFLRFSSGAIEDDQFTNTILKTNVATWDDEEVPVLSSVITDMGLLARQFLFITALEQDRSVGMGWTELGTATVSLLGAVRSDDGQKFSFPLLNKGITRGQISGKIMATSDESEIARAKEESRAIKPKSKFGRRASVRKPKEDISVEEEAILNKMQAKKTGSVDGDSAQTESGSAAVIDRKLGKKSRSSTILGFGKKNKDKVSAE